MRKKEKISVQILDLRVCLSTAPALVYVFRASESGMLRKHDGATTIVLFHHGVLSSTAWKNE
jgi:hypothetical protein